MDTNSQIKRKQSLKNFKAAKTKALNRSLQKLKEAEGSGWKDSGKLIEKELLKGIEVCRDDSSSKLACQAYSRLSSIKFENQLALVFLIDDSVSVGKLLAPDVLGKSFKALWALNTADFFSIIGMHSKSPSIVEFQLSSKISEEQIGGLGRKGYVNRGGFNQLQPKFKTTLRTLKKSAVTRKHVFVITDGFLRPAVLTELLDEVFKNKLSITFFALGVDNKNSKTHSLKTMAEFSGGKYLDDLSENELQSAILKETEALRLLD